MSASQSDPTEPLGTSRAWALTDLITRLRRVLRSSVRSDIPWETLPMAQVEILQRLVDEPGVRISDLARRHRLATNTVSTLIQQMVTAGLVVRTTAPDDRRAVSLYLTELGRTSLHGWLRANEARLSTALAELTEDEQRSIEDALPALANLAERLETINVE